MVSMDVGFCPSDMKDKGVDKAMNLGAMEHPIFSASVPILFALS